MWIAIAVIAVVSIIGRTVVAIIKASNSGGQFKPRMEDLEEQVHDLENDLQDARHRVEVLEKIVTSQKYDLGREIDELQSK
jgi:predicted  nucleic acid-binding Zn-ribbon protein|tara:strand:+ start:293 stop:535 length:243 start_codon:yes stop_codon:yes gene_type:complete